MEIPDQFDLDVNKPELDQLTTYEVFLVPKEGKPLESVGIVHADDPDMAFVFAKEAFSRRFTCIGMAVCPTDKIWASEVTEGDESAFDFIESLEEVAEEGEEDQCEVFVMDKRGKQHKHAASVMAYSYIDASKKAKEELGNPLTKNIWVVRTRDFTFNSEEDSDLWQTLPDKKYRDAIAYRAADKIKKFKESQQKENG
jgi:ring-1,2-phenylacetyl-CoA epoxidase subunit PaaB